VAEDQTEESVPVGYKHKEGPAAEVISSRTKLEDPEHTGRYWERQTVFSKRFQKPDSPVDFVLLCSEERASQ
jgi:hypothetical protein